MKKIQDYCIGLTGAIEAIQKVTKALGGNVDSVTVATAVEEIATAIEQGGGGGGGGDAKLTHPITTSVSVGGIPAGKTYVLGTPLETIFKDMLAPALYPTFTNPSVTISGTGDKVVEKGTTQNATITLTFNQGSITPAYGTNGKRSGEATGYILNGGTPQSGNTFNVVVSDTNKSFTGTVTYAEGQQPKDSMGNDYDSPLPAGSVSATTTLNYDFVLPFWYGVSKTDTITDFTGFIKDVSKKENKAHSYDTNNEYSIFAYDASYGALAHIYDPNGFDYVDGFKKYTITVDGYSYRVYVSEYATTDTGFEYRFNF